MRLASNVKTFPKFQNIGDRYSGTFVEFIEDVQGRFGPETIVVLDDGGTQLRIRCPASLVRTLREHREKLRPGAKMTLVYEREVPSKKGNPAKIIEVDIDGWENLPVPVACAQPTTEDAGTGDDDINY
jgi:hypothetical protein